MCLTNKHIMMEDYKELNRGQRVTLLGHTRDGGYLVCKIAGTDSLPLEHIVKEVQAIEEQLLYFEYKVKYLKAILRED